MFGWLPATQKLMVAPGIWIYDYYVIKLGVPNRPSEQISVLPLWRIFKKKLSIYDG
jgi:hypothetical protein